ncbi:MAG TPA: hypothetical protein VGB42_07510 [Candidatus Thermoplasmatota archaeon]
MAVAGDDGAPVTDARGERFGHLDFRAAEHIEVVLVGGHAVRIARTHFQGMAAGPELRLTTRGDEVFLGRHVTTIDGIDIGPAVAVARDGRGAFQALVVGGGGESGPLAVPFAFVREVTAHIILEPSEQEVRDAQREARALPGVAGALRRAARRAPPQR